MFPAVHQPEDETEKQNAAKHGDTVIHTLRIRFHRRRPHGEECAYDGVSYRNNGDGNACASKLEWPPRYAGIWSCEALV